MDASSTKLRSRAMGERDGWRRQKRRFQTPNRTGFVFAIQTLVEAKLSAGQTRSALWRWSGQCSSCSSYALQSNTQSRNRSVLRFSAWIFFFLYYLRSRLSIATFFLDNSGLVGNKCFLKLKCYKTILSPFLVIRCIVFWEKKLVVQLVSITSFEIWFYFLIFCKLLYFLT
jgi:hypothetical protein